MSRFVAVLVIAAMVAAASAQLLGGYGYGLGYPSQLGNGLGFGGYSLGNGGYAAGIGTYGGAGDHGIAGYRGAAGFGLGAGYLG